MRRLLVLCVLLALAGCGNGKAAESVNAAIRQMPGVAETQSDYQSSWTGDDRFTLTVVLDATATPDQAAAVGQKFSDLVNANDIADGHVDLKVEYPATISKSLAEFSFGERPPPVSNALREWLDIARSPGVAKVHWSGGLRVTVGPFATDSDLDSIARNHPNIAWLLIGLVDPLDSSSRADLSETYEVTGLVPDGKLREQWNRIVAKLGDVGHVAARTDAAAKPPTSVTINIPTTSGNRQQDLAQAWMTFPLLEGLPLPARVEYGADIFTVGGCTAADPTHASSALEAELRRKFERC